MGTSTWLCFLFTAGLFSDVISQALPTVYEYYTEGGISSGLEALSSGFKLNGKDITIQSGALHYFRVHPSQWRDRLRKLRATGLIAVETYVPWNLHEPTKGQFDFGDEAGSFSPFLDVQTFLKIAQEEDLLVLFRPGPYICAEWEMGGLPSWLLNIPGIKIRTSEKQYIERVSAYFKRLLPLIRNYQFTNNGPIIAVQLENEYSSVGYSEGPDQQYLRNLKDLMDQNGIKELLYTSDNSPVDEGSIPEALRTINFQNNVKGNLDHLKELQPDKPAMVMEFWTGWFDHWMQPVERLGFTPQAFRENLEAIMKYPASFNLYMFHGGTSFGFMNGANADNGKPSSVFDVTSYDYFAPLSESGDYTEKYNITKSLVSTYQPVKFKLPAQPDPAVKIAYPTISAQNYISLDEVLEQLSLVPIKSSSLVNMENLDINGGSGQSYGYTLYRASGLNIKEGDTLKITGYVHDIAQVYIDGKLQKFTLDPNDFGYWKVRDAELTLISGGSKLELLVENMGRINYGINVYDDRKGLYDGPVLINNKEIFNWEIFPLEFKDFIHSSAEKAAVKDIPSDPAPRLFSFEFTLPSDTDPADTFLDTAGWTKGNVIVNGFNLGRYSKAGPQQRLYLPGPLLVRGTNKIAVFELYTPGQNITFFSQPKLGGD